MRHYLFLLIAVVGVNVASAESVLDKMLEYRAAQAEAGSADTRIYVDGKVTTNFQVVAGNCLNVTLRGQSKGMDKETFSECLDKHFGGSSNMGVTTDEFVKIVEALGDYVLKVGLNTNADYNSALPFFPDMVKSITESILASARQTVKSTTPATPNPLPDNELPGNDEGTSPLPDVLGNGGNDGTGDHQSQGTAGDDNSGTDDIVVVLLVLAGLILFALLVQQVKRYRNR